MNLTPLVSVCIVAYNHENYISQCLDSVLMQKTSFSFEIILGEDKSNDRTRKICQDYANKYPEKIKLFLRFREDVIYINGSPTGRFNMIENLKTCKGKYIAICEGDDYWTDPLKLQKQVDFLEANSNVNICFHRAQILKNDSYTLHPIPEPFNQQPFNYVELIKHYNFIATASVLWRKPHDFKLPDWFCKVTFGDLGLYKLVVKDKKIKCLDEVMCVYRVHDNGIYSGLNALKRYQNYLDFYKIIFPILNAEEKVITTQKIKINSYKQGRLKFPKNRLLQKIYNMYIRYK